MLVSVLMPVYNSEEFIEKSINSILNQTFKEFEFIIIDDGSTDKTTEIIEKYAAIDPRIIFFKNETNMGLPTSLNRGILEAKGTYIARQDADDFSAFDRLDIQLKFALENQQIDLIGTNSYNIDLNDNIVYENCHAKTTNYFEKVLSRRGILPHGSAFIKKSKLIDVGLYDPRFYYTQDSELWLRMLTNGAQFHILNTPLYYYRLAPIPFTRRGNAKNKFNEILKLIYVENKSSAFISDELEKVRKFLTNTSLESRPFYKAYYWKNLANAAYFNGNSKKTSYNYIRKALAEENTFKNYVEYLYLSLVYLLPIDFVRKFKNKSVSKFNAR